MRLQLVTWKDVACYLKRSTGIIIPIGSCEQHGPTGLIGTDAICPEKIAWGVGEMLEALVAPTINFGMAQHHLAFPGSAALRPSTMIALIEDIVFSYYKHGFDRIVFLNGHGGNIPTINAAFAEVYTRFSMDPERKQPGPRCRLLNWFTGPRVTKLASELYGNSEGYHATPSEVSLTFYAYPEAVRQAPLSPRIAPAGKYYDCNDYRARFPDGRIGSDPSLASIEDGEQFYEAGVADVIEAYQAFLKEA